MYLYHIYCNQNNKLQERVAGSQHWHCQVETSWLYLYKVLNHILSCWPPYNWWPLHYKQQNVFAKGPKYRETKSINWKHNFNIIMNTMDYCAGQWAKQEKHRYYFMNLMKSIRPLLQIIINKLNGSMRTCPAFIFKVLDFLNICHTSMTNILSLQTRHQAISFLGVNHIT